jgi:hypothetical protein
MKVVFDLSAGKISIEGESSKLIEVLQAAQQIAPLLSRVEIDRKPAASQDERPGTRNDVSGQGAGSLPANGRTLKQFVRQLGLDNIAERVAGIAFYEKHYDNRDSFSPKEMGDWFTICGFQKPAQMPVAIFDTKRKYGYVDSAGHAKWKITTNGENLVIGKQNNLEQQDQE